MQTEFLQYAKIIKNGTVMALAVVHSSVCFMLIFLD